MQDQPTRGPAVTPAQEDEQLQAVVLHHLLDAYPAAFSLNELASELSSPAAPPIDCDDIQRAVRDLACAGLLHRCSAFVWPTRAARHAGQLAAS